MAVNHASSPTSGKILTVSCILLFVLIVFENTCGMLGNGGQSDDKGKPNGSFQGQLFKMAQVPSICYITAGL